MTPRAPYLDVLRAVAVIWMVIFHVAYDMRMFQLNSLDFSQGFWYAFPRVIAGTFLFCVGVALNFTHREGVSLPALLKRTKKVGIGALLVSLGTFIVFPGQWVYFGTLHCILVGSLLGAFFVDRRAWALGLLLLIVTLQYGFGFGIAWLSGILKRPSLDFIPIYPWFWVILLGILLGPYLSRIRALNNFETPKILSFLGRHSLVIYLLHQPLIFGALYLYQNLSRQ